MSDSTGKLNKDYRWRITAAVTFAFALIGLVVGSSIDTQHPDDRLADIVIPTLAHSTLGLLTGYLAALVVYRRLKWFDALAGLAIPPLLVIGYITSKSGDSRTGQLLGFTALGLGLFLVLRFVYITKHEAKSNAI